ncbi:MAG: hypothetical protein IPI10_19075 [Bacteroidetes bacterium]|nr:hypothetical protein [Bacteroidota bacterium]
MENDFPISQIVQRYDLAADKDLCIRMKNSSIKFGSTIYLYTFSDL